MIRRRMSSPRTLLAVWLGLMAMVLATVVGSTTAAAYVSNGYAGGGAGAGNSGDYLPEMVAGGAYRWAPNRLPLQVYIDDGEGVSAYKPQFKQLVLDAFNAWVQASAGRITWSEVNDPRSADIVCMWSDSISIRNGNLEAGRTTAITEVDRRTGQRYMRAAEVMILTRIGPKVFGDNEIRKTTLHEVGHALGLQGHSHYPGDIMYATLSRHQVPYLQDRDTTTIQRLYADYPQAGAGGGIASRSPSLAQSAAPQVSLAPRGQWSGAPAYAASNGSGGFYGGYSGGICGGYSGACGGYPAASADRGHVPQYSTGCGGGNFRNRGASNAQMRAIAEEIARRIYNSRNGGW